MQDLFAEHVFQLASSDQRVVLLSGDSSSERFQQFQEQIPERFFDCGTADARLINQAVGMALSGLRPIVFAGAAALTTRCLESIQASICRHKARVILAGADLEGVVAGQPAGARHDLALIRTLPNFGIVCPADSVELRGALRASLSRTTATYLRLAAAQVPTIHDESQEFRFGRVITVRQGTDACLVCTGDLLAESLEAATLLERSGVSVEVVSSPTVKPLDGDWLDLAFDRFSTVVTLEDHGLLGGFGAAVAEWLADGVPRSGRLLRLGTPEVVFDVATELPLERRAALQPPQIAQQVLKRMKKRRQRATA